MENVGGIEYTIDTDTRGAVDAAKRLTNENRVMSESLRNVSYSYGGFENSVRRSVPQLNQATKGIRGVRIEAQNLGYQIQDVAVMLQYGANPFLILSTQASQLLTGPMGAMIGAFAAVAGGIAMYLTRPAEDAAESIEDLIARFDELTEAQRRNLALNIGREMSKLGPNIDDAAAEVQRLTSEIQKQELILRKLENGTASGWLTDMLTSTEDEKAKLGELNNELTSAQALLDTRRQKYEKLKEQQDQVTAGTISEQEAIKELNDTYTEILTNYALQIELYGKSEREQAKIVAATKLQNDETGKLIEGVNAEIDAYYDLVDAQKAAADAQDAFAQSMVDTERAVSQIQAARNAAATSTDAMALGFNTESELQKLKAFYDQGLIMEQEYLAQKMMIQKTYEQQLKAIQEERFRAESEMNNAMMSGLDAMGATAQNVFGGMLSGTMSVKEAMGAFAQTIMNQAIGALVQMGIEQVKQQVIGQSAIAATTATAAAAGASMAASYAPAAAMASLASFGANAAPAQAGITATVAMSQGLSVAGGRATGGPVSAGSMYQVGEGNRPELMQTGGKLFAMPGNSGKVFNPSQLGGGAPTIIINEAPPGTTVSQQGDNTYVVDLAVARAKQEIAGEFDAHSGAVYDSMMRNTSTSANLR